MTTPLSHTEFSRRGGKSMSEARRKALAINAEKARAAKAKKREGKK